MDDLLGKQYFYMVLPGNNLFQLVVILKKIEIIGSYHIGP